jgi:hypothetical protein
MKTTMQESSVGGDGAALTRRRGGVRRWLSKIGGWFARNPHGDEVVTTMRWPLTRDEVWRGLLFYEEVPRRPWLLLRLFLPRPIRTEGGKKTVGDIVRCTYDGGHLVKRITRADAGRAIEFEVLEQDLGIEGCVAMGNGSYEIRETLDGSEVLLTTCYHGHLRPRFLWRPIERYIARSLHRHILEGMRETLAAPAALDAQSSSYAPGQSQPS